MLRHFTPASWTIIFMMLLMSLYLHAQKITKTRPGLRIGPAAITASFLRP